MKESAHSRLVNVIAPPTAPLGANGDWAEVERTLGTVLPKDYKEFISAYGTGTFHPAELGVWNFSSRIIDIDLFRKNNAYARSVDFSKKLSEFPVPILVWGADGLANTYFWAQDGKPDDWYVLVAEGGNMYYPFPELNMTGFLAKHLVDQFEIKDGLWVHNEELGDQTFLNASSLLNSSEVD